MVLVKNEIEIKRITDDREGKEFFIRSVFADVISDLKNNHGIEISMADLQAD